MCFASAGGWLSPAVQFQGFGKVYLAVLFGGLNRHCET